MGSVTPAVFSDEAIAAVREQHPGLARSGLEALEGIVNIEATYRTHGVRDSFKVRITAPKPGSCLPELYEIGGRTESIAKKWNLKDFRDLHCSNADRLVCLCAKQVEKQKFPEGSSLLTFIGELVIPYLFALAWFETHKRWLWGDYSHGGVGLLEFYADANIAPPTLEEADDVLTALREDRHRNLYFRQLKKPSAKRDCPCGRRVSFYKCHSKAWIGLRRFRVALARLNIPTNALG